MDDRRRFILWRGVIGLGLPGCLLWCAWMARPFTPVGEFLVRWASWMLTLPVWLGGGYIWGVYMWRWVRKKQQEREDRTG